MNPTDHYSLDSKAPQNNEIYLIGAAIFAYLFAQYASNFIERIIEQVLTIIPIVNVADHIAAKLLGLLVFYLICVKLIKLYLKVGKIFSSKELFVKMLVWFIIALVISRIYPIFDNIWTNTNWYRSMRGRTSINSFGFLEILGIFYLLRFLILALLVNQFAEKWRVQNLK